MLIRSRAPLRLGIAGGGTDVSPFSETHGGVVLNASINLHSYATIEPTERGKIEFEATDRKESFACAMTDYIALEGELLLHKGVYNRVVREFNDGEPMSIKITTFSDADAGSGLGTSSTMVVAILQAFVEYLKLPLGEYDIAHLAYEIERIELGLEGGKQDQYAATFGGFNFMEFYGDDRVIVNPLRIKDWVISELECSLVLYYTGRSRSSAAIIKDQIKNMRDFDQEATNAMLAIKADAFHMKEALLKGNIKQFGESLDQSWHDKKRLSGSITNPVIDDIYNMAKQCGAFAGKVSGAGGGGFMMFLIDPVRRMQLVDALKKQDGRVMNCQFSKRGATSWLIK